MRALPEIFDRGPIQLWSARPSGELDYVNGVVLAYFGRTFDEMIEWGWAECVHPEDLPLVGERWSEALETGQPYQVEFRLKQSDGDYHWHLGQAAPIRSDAGSVEGWVGANVKVEPSVVRHIRQSRPPG